MFACSCSRALASRRAAPQAPVPGRCRARQRQQRRVARAAEAAPAPASAAGATQSLVETAMLAACVGMVYVGASQLRLESYVSALLPLPIVVAALRGGAQRAWRTAWASSLLVLALAGPHRALSFALLHGAPAAVIGACWAGGAKWAVSIPASAAVRAAGTLLSLGLSSLLLGENVVALAASQAHALLDQLAATAGAASPPFAAVVGFILFAVVANSVAYVALLHLLYALLLARMLAANASAVQPPAWVKRL